jgi:biotin transport system substrate-specific component
MTGDRIARIAVFAALVAVFGLTPAVSVPGSTVPITLQTFAVMLAGLMLVPVDAFLSVGLFVALVAAGLPLLSGGRGGLAVFQGPSVGFVLGFPFAAAAVSVLAGLLGARGARDAPVPPVIGAGLACLLGGVAFLYCFGVPGWAMAADIPFGRALDLATAFIPGDLMKAVAASVVAVAAFRAAPFLRPGRVAARP